MVNSELVTWSNSLSVGIKLIDEQHKGLLKLTNDLFNHCVGDETSEREYFNKIIKGAVDYVKVHFSTEERLMLKTKFPGYMAHKREHDQFVLTVVEMVQTYNSGGKINLIMFTRFLKDWVLTHIAVSDKQYFEYFKKLATKKENGVLSITKQDIKRVS